MTRAPFRNRGSYFAGLLCAIFLAACSSTSDETKAAAITPQTSGGEYTCWDGEVVIDMQYCAPPYDPAPCWDGSMVDDVKNCPPAPILKTCTDGRFLRPGEVCSPGPVSDNFKCWDGNIYDHSYQCPAQPSREYCWDGITEIDPDNPEALCPPAPE